MKRFSKMTAKQKLNAAKDFLQLHQAVTERCKYDVRLRGDDHLEFFSVYDDSFYCTEEVVAFANFYEASFYVRCYDGKVVFIVY